MDLFVFSAVMLLVIACLAAFDLLAVRYGVDSRETIGDDRRRPLRT